jgi:hypothetical protein
MRQSLAIEREPGFGSGVHRVPPQITHAGTAVVIDAGTPPTVGI